MSGQKHLTTDDTMFIPYPEIGHGAQYHAYDMHNKRVLKIPLTEAETYIIARDRRNTIAYDGEAKDWLSERVQTFINGKARIPEMINHGFANSAEFLDLIGNPTLIRDYLPEDTPTKRWGAGRVTYTQDKLLMTHEILGTMANTKLTKTDVARLRQMIDAFAASIQLFWQYGFSDYVFKFGDTGFDEKGRLHFVDLGECTGDLDFILKAVEQQRWRNNIDQSKADFPQIPTELHDYFLQTLQTALSPAKLRKLWRQKHTCNDCLKQDDIINNFIAAKVAEIDYIDRW